jgi:preprotein translocase subunit SecA
MRKEILKSEDISKRVRVFIEDEVKALADSPLMMTDKFESVVREAFPFDEAVLDRLFDAPSDKFGSVLLTEAKELYASREAAFTSEIMRKVERDVYLQILDNLWMQHLENMDHMREGIHWMSVGQRDPLVEYRRQGQRLFEEMQVTLRHEVLRALFHARPIDPSELEEPIETELTRAARRSVGNVDQIVEGDAEFREADFKEKQTAAAKKQATGDTRKKARKAERQRKAKGRKRK